MGGVCTSVQFVPNNNIPGQDDDSLSIMKSLRFSHEEINILYRIFKKCDADNSNNIQLMELFHFFSAELTPFNRRIFSLFDDDNSGEINFLEFVCSNWNFLTLAKEDIGVIAFMMCDKTGQRTMELPELKTIVETMHGRSIEAVPVIKAAFDELFKNFTGRFLFHEFVKWTSDNPAVVVPLHALQVNIMTKLAGQNFWLKKKEQRYADPEQKEGRYIFKFQQKISEIHERKLQNEAVAQLNDQIKKVRKGHGASGKDRKQNEMMDKFGLGEKKEQRRGVNMPGDLDLAIREGNENILGANVTKEEKKKPRNTTVGAAAAGGGGAGGAGAASKSGKVSAETVVPVASAAPAGDLPTITEKEKEKDTKETATAATLSAAGTSNPRQSRKTIAVSGKSKDEASASGKDAARTSRKTVLPPIQQTSAANAAPSVDTTVPVEGSNSASESASPSHAPRRGRSTFVQKK